MSGGILGPEICRGDDGSGSYAAGASDAEERAASAVLEEFLSIDLVRYELRFTDDRIFRELVACARLTLAHSWSEGFSSQGFLDALIAGLALSGEPVFGLDIRKDPDYLLDAVVQALYDLGENNLLMDTAQLSRQPFEIGARLRGTPERPLAFTYRGDLSWVGHNCSHCKIFVNGYASTVGMGAFYSEFSINCPVGKVLLDGYFDDKMSVAGGDEKVAVHVEYPRFFLAGNRLTVPDGEGGWQEVRP